MTTTDNGDRITATSNDVTGRGYPSPLPVARIGRRRSPVSVAVIGRGCAAAGMCACACLLACSTSPTEPQYRRVTIRVTNTACDTVACAPLSIVGLPKYQPVIPAGGPWFILLGTMRSPTACFQFPLTETLTFQNQQGIVETLLWQNDDSVAIGIYPESTGYVNTTRITGMFVPSSAPGWRVTVPAGEDLASDTACASGK